MIEMIKVGMADLNVCISPNAITTLGLSFCVESFCMIQLKNCGMVCYAA